MSSEDPSAELIRFQCEACGKRLKVPRKFAGRTAPCPKCGATCPIPHESEPEAVHEAAVPVAPGANAPATYGPQRERPANLLDERIFTPVLCTLCRQQILVGNAIGLEMACEYCGRNFTIDAVDIPAARQGYVDMNDGAYLVSRFTGNEEQYQAVFLAAARSRRALNDFLERHKGTKVAQAVLSLNQHQGFWPRGLGAELPPQETIEFGKPVAHLGTPLDLAGADFREGVFYGTFWGFCGANLRGALLDNTKWLDLMGRLEQSDFSRASLRGALVFQHHCDGAVFRGADCAGATLGLFTEHNTHSPYASGLPADFREANFEEATLNFTMLAMEGDFSGANLRKCTIAPSDTCHAGSRAPLNFSGADLTEATIKRHITARFDGARMQGCRIPKSMLEMLSEKQRGEVEAVAEPKQCFIATAACGTEGADDVIRLRRFREEVLRRNALGRGFIRLYEHLSPPLARGIAHSEWLRFITRLAVVRPAAQLSNAFLAEPPPVEFDEA